MKEKQRAAKWSLLLIVAAVAAGGVGIMLRDGGAVLAQDFGIGTNGNVALLNELNANWTLPEDYSLELLEVDGIAMEWVQEKGVEQERVILQLHGGAYTRSLADNGATYRRAAVQYARLSGAAVLTVDYRVAPEYPYPAALEDALLAYGWLLGQGYAPDRIIIAGDSAGGGLTLALGLYLRDNGLPLPGRADHHVCLDRLELSALDSSLCGRSSSGSSLHFTPFTGVYRISTHAHAGGGDEILLKDTLAVARKAEEAGAAVQQTTYPGMFHVFQMLFPQAPGSQLGLG